jgi:hypothetical protein
MPGSGTDDVVPGRLQRSTSLVNIPTSVAADLAMLTDALDSPSSDIAATLSGLVSAATLSVPSFVGLSVLVGDPDALVEITTIEDPAHAAQIRTSLRFPLLDEERPGATAGVLLVYATKPGALVDLAADLTWLTGRPLGDARLDEDLGGPAAQSPESSLSRLSAVNQAVGVLIGSGLTQQEALAELDARVSATGVERHLVAAAVLACLPRDTVGRAQES